MHVVPVIDVRFGGAVRAVAGERANYAPLVTPFAKGSDPVEVARGLIQAFGFKTLYVADLDGIERRGPNNELADEFAAALPDVTIWLDDGMSAQARSVGVPPLLTSPTRGEGLRRDRSEPVPSPSSQRRASSSTRVGLGWGDPQHLPVSDRLVPVIGSESIRSMADYVRLIGLGPGLRRDDVSDEHVLSLDFRGDQFLGPAELLERPELWPDRVVVMTLARVGGAAGPDLGRISSIAARASPRSIYAAGGIRTIEDLRGVRKAGAHGALIATALHSGTIKPGDIRDAAGL